MAAEQPRGQAQATAEPHQLTDKAGTMASAGLGFAPALGDRRAVVFTLEGLWGAGKTTLAGRVGARLSACGFRTKVMHYGPRCGLVGRLSDFLERAPLRRRTGIGGFAQPHHATVDVLLRLAREAYHHTRLYQPATASYDVVVIDHGVYSKIAYALAVLREQYPEQDPDELLGRLQACVRPWFLHPDRAFFLDVPWPLARERAIGRARGGGTPGSLERLLFLPQFDAAYQHVTAAYPERVSRIPVGRRGVAEVLADVESEALALLRVPTTNGASNG